MPIERTDGIYFGMIENLPTFATLLLKSSSPQVWPDPKNQVEHQELKVPDSCCKTVGTSLILGYLSFLCSFIFPTLFQRWVKTVGGGTIRAIYITRGASIGELHNQIHCILFFFILRICHFKFSTSYRFTDELSLHLKLLGSVSLGIALLQVLVVLLRRMIIQTRTMTVKKLMMMNILTTMMMATITTKVMVMMMESWLSPWKWFKVIGVLLTSCLFSRLHRLDKYSPGTCLYWWCWGWCWVLLSVGYIGDPPQCFQVVLTEPGASIENIQLPTLQIHLWRTSFLFICWEFRAAQTDSFSIPLGQQLFS